MRTVEITPPIVLRPEDTFTVTLKAGVLNNTDRDVTVVGIRWEPVYAVHMAPLPVVSEHAVPADAI